MGNAILPKTEQVVNEKELTATPCTVRKGKIFYGAGTDGIQFGNLPESDQERKVLPLNGSYTIRRGIHNGIDEIYQDEHIPESPGRNITPVVQGVILESQGTYFSGDIIIKAIENLSRDVIKSGVKIGTVTGVYNGFPEDE